MGDLTLREGSFEDDLDALHELDPRWFGRAFLAERFASVPPQTRRRLVVAEVGGAIVGDAFVIAAAIRARGHAMASVWVKPEARGLGVGRALVETVAKETAASNLRGFSCSLQHDDELSRAVALHWGFEVAGHHKESVLDLDAMDVEAAREAVARVTSADVHIEALPPGADEDAWREGYSVFLDSWADAPDAEGPTEVMPYSVFRGFVPTPAHLLIARRDGRPVGVTGLCDRKRDLSLNTFFTGVSRSARGQGIATALKAAHALAMREAGEQRIYTQNMDQNTPILAANERLGFTVVDGYYDLARSLPW